MSNTTKRRKLRIDDSFKEKLIGILSTQHSIPNSTIQDSVPLNNSSNNNNNNNAPIAPPLSIPEPPPLVIGSSNTSIPSSYPNISSFSSIPSLPIMNTLPLIDANNPLYALLKYLIDEHIERLKKDTNKEEKKEERNIERKEYEKEEKKEEKKDKIEINNITHGLRIKKSFY